MDSNQLADKYRVAAPRYTSYPTVPYWDENNFDETQWRERLIASYRDSPEGLSVYVHLPFCESLCTYCGCNTRITKNHGVERPYIATVLKEWKLYVDLLGSRPVIKEIHLGGGTPTFFSPDNLELLIDGITQQAELHKDAEFSFEAHPNNTTEEHLKTLYNLGFKRLSLGIQDFDPVVQLVINRVQSVEAVENVTHMAREIGYSSVNYDLIYGLPLQSLNGLTTTLNAVIRLNPDRIAFYSYAHVPWVKPGQRRYTEAHLPSPDLKKQLYETGRGLLVAAGYAEIGMDHFTLTTDSLYQAEMKGTLHRNFMGYTEQQSDVMIGLGVSSISDCWTAFAQNVKTVEEYMRIVDAGRLPVFKGHILNNTDLVIRKHILNIMCRGGTSWFFPEERDENFILGIQRMKSLADDALVVLTPYDLKVTPLGKRFLRNICMALDARLWAHKPATQLFSMAD
ncbi:oxygen-independent coproporphyrinogen III oxidase [Pedobacter psychroterrae]|uniref:Coproporphyrinogen-III oxidase n=1 Tax=Pedobacter psychroterrae TaxID=2530453 RepID=A0A4R0NK56_9SPHI|nr:oxygen-independent coproporphyrinogen III oxidase [Pedobacter psychroterrae]TCD01112.1 oxygen-independent coproporphyrinogen III oxidase [Pedobacter psychroterrae]